MVEVKLTKAEIIENIYEDFYGEFHKDPDEDLPITRKDIHQVIDKFLGEVKQALVADRVIELRGFGTFEIKMRKGREKARNPKTGEIVSVENHGVAVFRPGKALKAQSWDLRE